MKTIHPHLYGSIDAAQGKIATGFCDKENPCLEFPTTSYPFQRVLLDVPRVFGVFFKFEGIIFFPYDEGGREKKFGSRGAGWAGGRGPYTTLKSPPS